MQTSCKVSGREVVIKATKAETEHIVDMISRCSKIGHYVRELYGVHGESERQSLLFVPIGQVAPIRDKEGFQRAWEDLVTALPAVITPENFIPFIPQLKVIFEAHVPVVDKRESREQVAARQQTIKARETGREQERNAWQAQYCPANPVNIPKDSMAVTLSLTYDDSDSMTDYYNPHASIGEDMLLAIAPKQAKTERLVRSILARYPALVALQWEWNTENYSMGHGNYLQSEYFDTVSRAAYDGRKEVRVRWEIKFTSYTESLRPYRDYPGNKPNTLGAPHSNGHNVEIAHNETLNGLEIRFPAKPDASVLESLKALGMRWSQRQGLWWGRYTPALESQVKALVGS